MKFVLSAFAAGLLFAFGLGLAGMTDPANVQGFLDITGDWKPALAFVMGGALATHALMRRFILRRPAPVLATAFPNTANNTIDRRLLGGAALFGIGWGLSGYCPGPAFVSVATGAGTTLAFVAAMLGGMALFQLWDTNLARAAARRSAEVSDEGEVLR